MDQQIKKYKTFADADPNAVIVTLFKGDHDDVRGWFVGPVCSPVRSNVVSRTSPQDNLLGAIAIFQAFELAQLTGADLCIVDPENLWGRLSK